VTLHSNDGTPVARLLANPTDVLRQFRLGQHRFFSFTTADSVRLNGWMLTPPDFDSTLKYPVLMYVYGGPGSQRVVDRWEGDRGLWHRMLAATGIIVACVDGRGTGGRGRAFETAVSRRLGVLETTDQLQAAGYLSHLPYVDSSRIGIWGWSYGGYMTCMALTAASALFKTGIAVAPVTDWQYYDAIYTERYMRSPAVNPAGYRLSSPLRRVSALQGNLLVVHGTTDDNVHWQNSVVFIEALIRANKQVRTMMYPDRDHDLKGGNVTRHLYDMMTGFLRETL
jgi:dipeptidyl-peptidase-4